MKQLTTALAIFALLVLLLSGYVGAYLGLGKLKLNPFGDSERAYANEWLPPIFKPAAAVESYLRGETVAAVYPDWDLVKEEIDW